MQVKKYQMSFEDPAVLLVRPKPLARSSGKDSLVEALEVLGYRVFQEHLFEHRLNPVSPPVFVSGTSRPGAYLFSSATALEALALQDRKTWFCDVPVLAVGGQTAIAAKKLGFHQVLAGKSGMVELMHSKLSWLDANIRDKTILHIGNKNPVHQPGQAVFYSHLDSSRSALLRKFQCLHWPVYETRQIWKTMTLLKKADCWERISCLCFFSQRNARAFLDIVCPEKTVPETGPVFGPVFGLHHMGSGLNRKTVIVNSRDTANLFFDRLSGLAAKFRFKEVKVTKAPTRQDFLALMAKQIEETGGE